MAEIAPPPPQQEAIVSETQLSPTLPWSTWFQAVASIQQAVTMSGTTAQRPTSFLFLGRRFYDTSLLKPVYLSAAGPPPVWRDASGAIV